MNWNKLIAILFSVVYIILSMGMLLLSKEDSTLAYGAFGFFVISLVLLWVLYALFESKQLEHKTLWFILLAICITSTTVPAYWIAEKISTERSATLKTNFRNTQVTNFRDEVLFTERNNPIGIRLRYTVLIPQSGRYFPEPRVSDGKSRAGLFYLTSAKIDPLPRLERPDTSLAGNYNAGIYNIIVDLRPNFLLPEQKTGNPCVYFANLDEENFVKTAEFQKMEVDIQGTSFSRYYGQGIHYLENDYNLKDFYDSIAEENIPKCAL